MVCKDAINSSFVRYIAFNKNKIAIESIDLLKSLTLDIYIVVVVHVVDADNLYVLYFRKDSLNEIAANETSCTRDKDCFAFEGYIIIYHCYLYLL